MKQLFLHKTIVKTTVLGLILGTLSSCQESTGTPDIARVDESVRNITPYLSVLDMFSCKPANAAFVAAHRGTVENSVHPENALESLQALHAKGVKFAEIDIAGLKDGTLILFHDGVWDRKTTGKGVVAATDWPTSQKLLLRDTQNNISAIRPSRFTDVLAWAKDKIYLEIDFKSSADYGEVITAIRNAGMIEQVILISYNTEQALKLHKLAPKAALSVGIFKPGDVKALEVRGIPTSVMTAWTGKGPLTASIAKSLRDKNIPILAASFYDIDDQVAKSGDLSKYTDFAKLPDLIVSDRAFKAQSVLTLKGSDLTNYNSCVTTKQHR